MIDPIRDDKQFRRGVVLGLTMAEILLLLIFLLMLLMAVKFKGSEEQRLAAVKELSELKPVVQELQRQGVTGIDITKDYVRVKQELVETKKKLADAQPALDLIEKAKKLSPKVPTEEAVQSLAEAAAIGKQVMQTGNDPEKLLASAASCKADLQSCQGQTAYLNKKLNDQTGGKGVPPCWADENGNIQFIFEARLREEGIVLVDKHIASRISDEAALPIQRIRFDQALETDTFASQVSDIFRWSQQHECRFYVELYDETGANAKPRYKTLRRSVENSFYIRIAD